MRCCELKNISVDGSTFKLVGFFRRMRIGMRNGAAIELNALKVGGMLRCKGFVA